MGTNNKSLISDFRTEWLELSRAQKWLYVLYALVLIPHIAAVIGAILRRVGFGFIEEYTNTILIVFAIIGCLPVFVKKLNIWDVVFYLLLVTWHQISSVIYPETAIYVSANALRFIFTCLPLYFIGCTFDNNTSRVIFVVIAYIGLVLEILFLYVFGMEIDVSGDERTRMMSRAYSFLPLLLILMWNVFERGGVLNTIGTIIGVFVLFAMGTRGPIICLAFFIAVYFILFKKFKYNVLVKLSIVLATSVFYWFSYQILFFMSTLSSSFGLSTRVFDSIVEKQMTDFSESSGRDGIIETILDYLKDKDMFFNAGFYTDRIASGSEYYAHNLEVEFICDFGMIGGPLLLLVLFVIIFKAFKRVWENNTLSSLLLVFFCSSIMQLQFSNSFLLLGLFWLLLGMCISFVNKKNHINYC